MHNCAYHRYIQNPQVLAQVHLLGWTGANSGIEYATAKKIASASSKYHVIICSRSLEKGENAASEIKSTGIIGSLSVIQLDVHDDQSIQVAAQHFNTEFGQVDVLLHSAGISTKAESLDEQLDESMKTNVIGMAVMIQVFSPLLLKLKNPYLMYTSSGMGSMVYAATSGTPWHDLEVDAYRASKAAMNMLLIQNSKALGKKGVKAFAVCPGLVISNLRGTSAERRNAGGYAIPAEIPVELMLSIIKGKKDADVDKFVHKDGTYPW